MSAGLYLFGVAVTTIPLLTLLVLIHDALVEIRDLLKAGSRETK